LCPAHAGFSAGLTVLCSEIRICEKPQNISRHPKKNLQTKTVGYMESKTEMKKNEKLKFA
jgi:hypothetical protein